MALGIVVVDSATYTVVVVVFTGSPAMVVVVVVGIGTVVDGGGNVVVVVWPGIVVGGSVVGTVVPGTVVVVERGTVVVVVEVEVDVVDVVEVVVVVVVVVVGTTRTAVNIGTMAATSSRFCPKWSDFTPTIFNRTVPRGTSTRRPPLIVIHTVVVFLSLTVPVASEKTETTTVTHPFSSIAKSFKRAPLT